MEDYQLKKEELKGSYGGINRSEKPIPEELSSHPGWHDISKNGGGDIDLSDYPLQ